MPLTGGVQGKFYTDVNHLATRIAERLGGKAMLIHAPLFAESRDQRDMLMGMGSIKEVFDLARRALSRWSASARSSRRARAISICTRCPIRAASSSSRVG